MDELITDDEFCEDIDIRVDKILFIIFIEIGVLLTLCVVEELVPLASVHI